MSRVVHFEVHADDIDRAKAFYGDVFGWEFLDYGGFMGTTYWGIITGPEDMPGINGGLLQRVGSASGAGANAFVCTMQVDDYDLAEARILASGGTVAMPKAALTGTAWQGYYRDTEGNTFGLHQDDPNAA